jgi:hypothetical protein
MPCPVVIDLHAHTTASDGSLSLRNLVAAAKKAGLKAIAITDHDTVLGAKKTSAIERGSAMEFIPGVELSVYDRRLGYADIHVLGLYIDPENRKLCKKLAWLAGQREAQKKATVAKLRKLGYEITFAAVRTKARGVVGRPHIAMALAEKYPKEFRSLGDVFAKLLGRGRPAYLERKTGFGLAEAISLIHDAGGLAFLAHPFVYQYDKKKIAADFRRLGGDGLETHYDYVTNQPEVKRTAKENARLVSRASALASELGLLQSGGSDFHGTVKRQKLGKFGAPDAFLVRIKAALAALVNNPFK